MVRALVSVHDKTGVIELARVIHELGGEILSTGGTAAALSAAGIPVTQVSAYTLAPRKHSEDLQLSATTCVP